jgi:hypothetical protein
MAKYRWGNGKGKVHSISLGQHKKNVRSSRKAKARQKDLDAVTAPKGLSDIRRDANTASSLRYGGEERALGLQSQQVPAWFAAYRGQVAGVAQGVNAGYQKAVDEQRAQAAAQQATAGAQQKDAATAAQADAANRGATVDPGVQQQALQGANVNASAQNELATLLATQQAATGNYYGGLQAASSAAQLGASQRVAGDQRALKADKGLYKSQYVSDARDKEHTKVLERQAYGLDVAKAQADVADDRADNRAARRKERLARRDKRRDQRLAEGKFRSDEEKDDYQRKNKLGPYKPAAKPKGARTPAERRKSAERIKDVVGRWKLEARSEYNFGTDKAPDVRKPTPDQIRQKLIKAGFTTTEIDRAIARIKKSRRGRPTPTKVPPKSKGPNGQLRPN